MVVHGLLFEVAHGLVSADLVKDVHTFFCNAGGVCAFFARGASPYVLSGMKVFFPNDASVAFWFVVMTLVLSFSWPDERAPRPPHQKCGT